MTVHSKRRVAGWFLAGISGLYALFALGVAVQTALALAEPEQIRAAPPLFVLHAITGAVALLTASLQLGVLATPPTVRQRPVHRMLGRLYVIG